MIRPPPSSPLFPYTTLSDLSSRPPVPCAASTRDSCRSSFAPRSEEHTSELQSRVDLVCRLLLGKKNQIYHVGRLGRVAPDVSFQHVEQSLGSATTGDLGRSE